MVLGKAAVGAAALALACLTTLVGVLARIRPRTMVLVTLYLMVGLGGALAAGGITASAILAVRVLMVAVTVLLVVASYPPAVLVNSLGVATGGIGLVLAISGLPNLIAGTGPPITAGRLAPQLIPVGPNEPALLVGVPTLILVWRMTWGVAKGWHLAFLPCSWGSPGSPGLAPGFWHWPSPSSCWSPFPAHQARDPGDRTRGDPGSLLRGCLHGDPVRVLRARRKREPAVVQLANCCRAVGLLRSSGLLCPLARRGPRDQDGRRARRLGDEPGAGQPRASTYVQTGLLGVVLLALWVAGTRVRDRARAVAARKVVARPRRVCAGARLPSRRGCWNIYVLFVVMLVPALQVDLRKVVRRPGSQAGTGRIRPQGARQRCRAADVVRGRDGSLTGERAGRRRSSPPCGSATGRASATSSAATKKMPQEPGHGP